MKKFIRFLFKFVIGLFLIVVVLFAGLTFLRIPIDLTRFKQPVEMIMAQVLDRPVHIEKSLVLSTSIKPVFTLSGLRIGNPEGFSQKSFMYLDTARIQVELVPLLKKKLHITDITIRKLNLTLEEKEDGKVNWALPVDSSATENEKEQSKEAKGRSTEGLIAITGDTIVVKNLNFEDISVDYYSPGSDEPSRYQIDKCIGTMLPGTPLKLDISGSILSFPYSLAISIASLDELLKENKSWIDLQAEIAETVLSFGGNVDLASALQSLALKASVKAENLSSLNDLLGLDLPPLKNYGVETSIVIKKHNYELENLTIKTGVSELVGTARIIVENDIVNAEIDFRAPLIQLDDFIFDNWSLKGDTASVSGPEKPEENVATTEKPAQQNEDVKKRNRALVDPELLARLNTTLTIQAEQVLSGTDELGNGSLKVSLQDGRVAIESLDLSIPGGSIKMSASLKPGTEQSEASVKAVMKNFDIGILVRRNNPEAEMSGLINLDVDLKSSAATIDQLLPNGNGYFDFSGQLKNIKAGIIDLWAVNLVAAIVSSTDENQSQINCAVGRWSVKDGLLRPDAFFIDTSKIRICGTGQIDFKKNRIDLTIAPTPKKPEFFSLATPLEVHGTFADINLGIKASGLVGTAARFIVSPIAVPIKRVVSEEIPEDGSDACTVTLGSENRNETVVSGCN